MVIEKVEGGLDSERDLDRLLRIGGVPVIFLHSLAGSVRHWFFQLQHLEKKRRAIAMQLPGHAAFPPLQDEHCSIDSLAKDIDEVVDKLDLSRFVLVGHSFGATVAIAYAAQISKEWPGFSWRILPEMQERFPSSRQAASLLNCNLTLMPVRSRSIMASSWRNRGIRLENRCCRI